MENDVFVPFGEEFIVELTKKGNSNFTRGAFGEISIALKRGSSTKFDLVAIKIIEQTINAGRNSFGGPSTDLPSLSKEVINEICALRHLSPHPNIVNLVACYPAKSSFSAGQALSLVFEYAPTDLYVTLEWRRRRMLPPLPMTTIQSIAYDLFTSLAHCHRYGVLHRDVKPANLLVSSSGRLQLCDFGLAKPFLNEDGTQLPLPTSNETGTKGLCTLWYRPPEVLLGGPAIHPSVDIYSAGLVLAELFLGKPLFKGPTNVVGQLSRIYEILGTPTETTWPDVKFLPDYGKLQFMTHEPKPWKEILPHVTEFQGLENLMAGTIALDSSQRWSATTVLGHSFLARDLMKTPPRAMKHDLIPPPLDIPPFLARDNASAMTTVALSLAKKRKNLLTKDTIEWCGSDLPTTNLTEMITNC